MQSRYDVISTLKVEHDRLGQLLGAIDNGRWWTTDNPTDEEMAGIVSQISFVRAALDEIERTVGHLGSRVLANSL